MGHPAVQTSSDAPSDLIERGDELSVLGESVEAVRSSSRGRLVFVAGEAGVGKTALLTRFCEDHADGARVLWGACDALFTPRPLGPFLDIAESTGGELAQAVESGAGTFDLAAALMSELRRRSPTILVLEDVHWADDATLDLLRLLARRVKSLPVALLVSYRQTELSRFHPLRQVLGEFGSAPSSVRLKLAPLSPAAVARLAEEHGVDGAALHERTGGNPFFVTEVLAAPEEIPETVRDAVLARTARLTPAAQELLEAVAIAPPQAELPLLEQCAPDALPALDECLSSGMLVETNGAVSFRHELARLAVEQAAAPDRRLRLHRATLATLRAAPEARADLARLAHHAESARDTDAVLELAPPAGARASALGGHREAAAQYARALRFADGLPLAERAELLRLHTQECYVTTQDEDALSSSREALDAWTQLRRAAGTGGGARRCRACGAEHGLDAGRGRRGGWGRLVARGPAAGAIPRPDLRPDRRREPVVRGPRRDRAVEPPRARHRDRARSALQPSPMRSASSALRRPSKDCLAASRSSSDRSRWRRVCRMGQTSSAGRTCSSPWPAAVHGPST